TVRNCSKYAAVAKSPVKATLASWPSPDKPCARVHSDYAGPYEGTNFLVIEDAYSKWPEIFRTDRTTANAMISLLRQVCAKYEMPETIVSDNGTQFVPAEFENFCAENGIKHVFSPPCRRQSNDQAEQFVDTFTCGLHKLKGEGTLDQILQTFLLSYRLTSIPTLDGSKSPAELFIGRKPPTTL
ncbi:Uncharacterized protein K02A2.6, partial [Toxocara canis]